MKKRDFDNTLKALLSTPHLGSEHTMLKREKINCYKDNLFKYGFITLVYLIACHGASENFEECALILKAIRQVNSEIRADLPTKFDESAIEYFRKAWENFGLDAENASRAVPAYAIHVAMTIQNIEAKYAQT